jgi:hypothetical protein
MFNWKAGILSVLSPHDKYKAQRAGSSYDALSDSYVSSALHLSGGLATSRAILRITIWRSQPAGSTALSIYRARVKFLRKSACMILSTYARLFTRLATRVWKRMLRVRASTVEPVLGSRNFITWYGLQHISRKRQAAATKVMYSPP